MNIGLFQEFRVDILDGKWFFYKEITNSVDSGCGVNLSTPNDVLKLCYHRSPIQCVIANGLISVGERYKRGKENVQYCGAATFHVNCDVSCSLGSIEGVLCITVIFVICFETNGILAGRCIMDGGG